MVERPANVNAYVEGGRYHFGSDSDDSIAIFQGETIKSEQREDADSYWQKTEIQVQRKFSKDENRPYICQFCRLAFSQKGNLTVHLRLHAGDRPFQCEMCYKSFARKQTLVSHQRIHSNEKPYACQECDRSFSQRSQLTRHKRTHSGIKPFPCKLCPKRFSDKRNLITHLRNFHREAGDDLVVVLQQHRRVEQLDPNEVNEVVPKLK
eukprot:138657_1